MPDASRYGDLVTGAQLYLLASHVPVSRTRFNKELLFLEEMEVRDGCHEARGTIAPFVVVRTDLSADVLGRRREEFLSATPAFVKDVVLRGDVCTGNLERLKQRHHDIVLVVGLV